MKYLPKPCFRKALILFSLLIVSGKHHFPLCRLSSSDLIFFFFWYKVTIGKKGQKSMLEVKGGTSEFSAVCWRLHRFDLAASKQKWWLRHISLVSHRKFIKLYTLNESILFWELLLNKAILFFFFFWKKKKSEGVFLERSQGCFFFLFFLMGCFCIEDSETKQASSLVIA